MQRAEAGGQKPERRRQKSAGRRSGWLAAKVAGVCLAALSGIAWAGPRVVYTRRIEKPVLWSGASRAVVFHRYGGVTVTGSDEGQALVDAVIRVTATSEDAARKLADRIDVETYAAGDSVLVTTAYPDLAKPDSQLGYEVELDLELPQKADLDVYNSFGDVQVSDMLGVSRVFNRFGDVEMDDLARCEVTNHYGNVTLSGIPGPVRVVNCYGDVSLDDVDGQADIENHYGEVETDRSDGSMKIVNEFGNVLAYPGRGNVAIDNSYGDVSTWVRDAELSALNILSRMGKVHLCVRHGVPFRIGAQAHQGQIFTGLPLPVSTAGVQQTVSGRLGSSGPRIVMRGVWSDLVIRADTPATAKTPTPEEK